MAYGKTMASLFIYVEHFLRRGSSMCFPKGHGETCVSDRGKTHWDHVEQGLATAGSHCSSHERGAGMDLVDLC